MLGGFNLVKHENHHYKYSACKTDADMAVVNPNFRNDLTPDGEWVYPLPFVTSLYYIFPNLKNLKKWSGALPKLGDGYANFIASGLVEWNLDLPSLYKGQHMFNEMYRVFRYKGKLPSLTLGDVMFNTTVLESFMEELPKLSSGDAMFTKSVLDIESVLTICSSIPTYTSGTHKLTLGINADYNSVKNVLDAIASAKSKGWTLTVNWNGNITKNEVINSEKIAKLELDSIILPYGYRRCEYLESDTNNQYINTEIIPTNTTGTWIIAKRITETVDGQPLAARTDSNYYYPPVLRLMSNFHGWGTTTEWTDFTKQNTAFESYINYPINGTITKEAVAINNAGTSVTKALTTELPTISHSLYLFGRNYNGTLERQWNGRIYRAKISEGDQIIRDFIPTLDPDGKPCMYEMIEGKPYYNAATSGDDFLYKVYEDYVMPELPPYDIVEGSEYIPDASSWNSTAYEELTAEGKIIVRVENGIAYDDEGEQ